MGLRQTNNYLYLQVDHLNQNISDNRRNNLIITTELGNKANKKGLGVNFINNSYYQTTYKTYYKFLKNHNQISNVTTPTFKTEQEAKEEVFKRKWLANYIRPQFKNLNEYLIFEEEYNLNKKNKQDIDEYWITTKFPEINEIEISSIL